MARRFVTLAWLAGAALLSGAQQAVAACSLKTVDVPVKMEGLRPLVSVKVDGQPRQFLLDSGSAYNSISAKVALDQKLKPAPRQTTGTLFTAAGESRVNGAAGIDTLSSVVLVSNFEFAGQSYRNEGFFALGSALGGAEGIVGQNFLRQVDVDYDLGGGMVRLVKPQECGGSSLAYWVPPGASYSVMPLEAVGHDNPNAHTIGMIIVNGVKMRAYFDTGASTSFITDHAAQRAGVKASDPGVKLVGSTQSIDRSDIKTWIAPFADIKIGDEEIKNTQLAIGESQAFAFDILIGADFFLAHHVYVANSQGKLYFTYRGGPVFNVKAQAVAAPNQAVREAPAR